MGEILNAHVSPEIQALIQSQDRDRNAWLSMARQAIIDGIRQTQLPRPVRSAKAGMTVTSQSTEGYPADLPDDFTSGLVTIGTSVVTVWAPTEPRNALLLLVQMSGGAGSQTDVYFGTRPGLSATAPMQDHRIALFLNTGESIFVPLGRGLPVSENKPLLGVSVIARTNFITIFHGPVRE